MTGFSNLLLRNTRAESPYFLSSCLLPPSCSSLSFAMYPTENKRQTVLFIFSITQPITLHLCLRPYTNLQDLPHKTSANCVKVEKQQFEQNVIERCRLFVLFMFFLSIMVYKDSGPIPAPPLALTLCLSCRSKRSIWQRFKLLHLAAPF